MIHPLIVRSSPHSVRATADRLVQLLESKKIRVFARINHGEAAQENGLSMQDEEVIIFGSPKVGTGLMKECPPIGIELPIKIVIWQAEQTMVGYYDPKRLAKDFSVPVHAVMLEKMSELLSKLAETITRP